jgi:GMP synthase-like glutamine amidotransferase
MGIGPLPSFFVTAIQPRVLAIQNDPTDPPLLVGTWLAELGIEVEVVRAYESEEVPRTVPAGVHGILALGGSMGANDDLDAPWLPAERALLRDAVATSTPVLGLCLGSQLLAAALGGKVELAATTEIGLSFVGPTDEGTQDAVVSAALAVASTDRAGNKTLPAIQWHQDHVAELPEGAHLLLSNEACRVQGFRVGASAYGFQCHPEIDAEVFLSWADFADEALIRSGTDVATASNDVQDYGAELVTTWRPATHTWAELVIDRCASSEASSS